MLQLKKLNASQPCKYYTIGCSAGLLHSFKSKFSTSCVMGLVTERTKASWDWKHRLLNGIAFSDGEVDLPSDVGD